MNPKLHRDRATWAALLIVLGGGILWASPGILAYPVAVLVLTAAGGLALIYFAVGVIGATGGEPDFMAKFWPAVFAAGAGFLMGKGCYLPREFHYCNAVLQALYVAVLAAAVVRFLLVVKPLPRSVLPDPSKVGLPMSGPASQQAAHAALSRNHPGWTPPKFRT